MRARLTAAAAIVVAAATACTTQSAVTRREVVVKFSADATQAQHDAARAACSGLPRTTPEPAPSNAGRAGRLNDVRFRVDLASDAQLNALYKCLVRQPGVIGVDIPAVQ